MAYGVAGLAAGVLLGTLPTGAYGMAQAPAVPVPVETLQTSTLWQAAEASYAAEAPGGSPFLVHTPAIRRWTKSPRANTDLLTAFDMPLEALGHFTWAPYPEVEAAFVANMAASHPGPIARAVLTGLIALGHDPRNLPVVAETLFPGPEGLNRLIADAHFYGTFQGALPGLLKAYGLSGSAGVSYATHHPEDTALISALASTAITAQKAERLWSVLPRAADQMAFLAAFPYGGPPGSVTLERTATPYAKEVLLEDQYQSESSSHSASAMRPVLVELNRLANRYGIGRTQVGVPLSVLTAALNEDPSGFLARSVAAYVRVRHAPYFGLQRCHMHYDCWPYSYGRVQYDPTRGVKGWPGFLARYSRAPGADDASYRLGRDEELLGHYGRAVVAFNHGLSLPAGGTAYDLAVREVWVLDTEMTPDGLSRLYASLPKTQRILRLRVLYSLGVDLLRSGAYTQAQATLTHVAHAIGSASLAPAPGVGTWPFAAAVRVQAMQAGDLARLTDEAKAARTPAARAQIEYDIAAFMYHRTLLFYNQLWAGREQSYFFQGYQPPVATPAFVAYEERENNYVQAADRFHALQASWVPQAIRARALFSYGMSLYRLGGYGIDASVLASPSTLAAATANAFGAYARTYPDRALAPEALTLEAAFTRDRGLLNTLVKRYGTTPQGRDAATDLRQTPWPASDVMTVGLSVPSREIYQDTPGVPKSILMWADAKGPVVEARTLGPVTYIRVKPPELSPGVWPILASVTDAGVGKLTVTWTTGHLAVGVAHPVVLFRTFALIEVTGRETVANTVEQRANTAYAQ